MIGSKVLHQFPKCAYCAGRTIFEETVCDLALKCEDCPCRMVVPNRPGNKAKLLKAWTMRIGEPPKVRIKKPRAGGQHPEEGAR